VSQPLFNRIAIIGLGLIGGSIARAARERGLANIIAGFDANDVSVAYARKHKCIDVAAGNVAEAVAGSDLVILATPPFTLEAIAEAIAPHLEKGAIVMDVCSVKQAAMDAIAPHIPEGVEFIPAHPIAGAEKSGASAGRGDLFVQKRVIVTPDHPEQTDALRIVAAFWQDMGARVEAMPAHLHDLVYAYVSHLPHLLAFATSAMLVAYENNGKLQQFLRLSNSNPAMWAEIFSLNQENVLLALDHYLMQAPDGSTSEDDTALSYTSLFPRIAASCLVTTIMQAEKRAGFAFAHFAGSGFADFVSPAAVPPEDDIEQISGHYKTMAKILKDYIARLKKLRGAMVKGNVSDLTAVIAE
jgi:cyclohexadieny/prephenate dehydrogenase